MTPETASSFDLRRVGWDDAWAETMTAHAGAGLVPGRVTAQHRAGYAVLMATGETQAETAGRLRHDAAGAEHLPAVGDWVALDAATGLPIIRTVLPRRSALARKAAGRATTAQVLAANVDVVLVVCSLSDELNARRLERYLGAAWESGAAPAVILTKADLDPDAGAIATDLAASVFVPVHPVSALTGDGMHDVQALLAGDRTVVLVGPSGAGKSTLVNRLLGDGRQATNDLRRDGKGRHTTVQRELFLVPGGGVVIDTPGLRELALWGGEGGATDQTFSDVAELAAGCRFADCAHEREPGCAVVAAIEEGRLGADRLESFRKLERELAWTAGRRDGRAIAEARRARRRFARSMRRPSEGPWQG